MDNTQVRGIGRAKPVGTIAAIGSSLPGPLTHGLTLRGRYNKGFHKTNFFLKGCGHFLD